jgi:cytochrome c553
MKRLQLAILATLTLAGSALAADWPAEDLWYKCKGCHGMDGKANTKVGVKENIPDLASPKWQAEMTDEAILQVIANGSTKNPKMKAYKEIFSPAEIASLIPYIRNLREK